MDTLTNDTIALILMNLSRPEVTRLVFVNRAILCLIVSVENSYYDKIQSQFGSIPFYKTPCSTWIQTYHTVMTDPIRCRRIPIFNVLNEDDYDVSLYEYTHMESYVAFFPNNMVLTIRISQIGSDESLWKSCRIYTLDEYIKEEKYFTSTDGTGFDREGIDTTDSKKYAAGLAEYRKNKIYSAVAQAYYQHNFMFISSITRRKIFLALRYTYINRWFDPYDMMSSKPITPKLYHGAITDLMSLDEIYTELNKEVGNWHPPRPQCEQNLSRYEQILPYITS